MEGGETRLERRTDVGGLGQRKREAARRKEGLVLGRQKQGGERRDLGGGLFFGSRRDQSGKEGQLWMEILLLRVKKRVYSVA